MAMDVQNLNDLVDQVAREKNIDRKVLIEALEQAILTAARKVFGGNREFEASFNEDTGQVDLFQYMTVVEEVEDPDRELSVDVARRVDPEVEPGDELGFQIFYRPADAERAAEEDRKYGDILGISQKRRLFGRIAAQHARQVIFQRIREAERDLVYNEYKDRVGDIVTGIVWRFERGHIIVDLGRAEAILPIREQIPKESYRAGDRVQAYVKEVNRNARGQLIVLSRSDPGIVRKLFEMEVPEIYEGIVTIVAVAREPGERAKIAVASNDSSVDPVGACVGMKGSRVQAVVQELRGERIDIIPWSPDIARFVCNAIQPAQVSRVLIDEDRRTIELIVPDDQLSLAIGRRGQNVRLASKLVNWKIEVNSESRIEQLKHELWWYLVDQHGVNGDVLDYLFKLGYHSPEALLNADVEELAQFPMVDEDTAQQIQQLAYELKKKKDKGLIEIPPMASEDEYEEEAAQQPRQGDAAASGGVLDTASDESSEGAVGGASAPASPGSEKVEGEAVSQGGPSMQVAVEAPAEETVTEV